jgi:hypothetical protein
MGSRRVNVGWPHRGGSADASLAGSEPGANDGGMTPDDAVERADEVVVGWRTWDVSLDDETGPLLLPVGSGVDVWAPRRPLRARCGVPAVLSLFRRPHEAPDPGCRCGIYAARSLDAFDRPRPAWPPPPVLGTVSLWGRVIEHERGWRAAFAYPARLRLVCSMCAWFEPGPGAPVTVHRFLGRLYTLCERHRGGIEVPDTRRSRPTDVDPRALEASLLGAYAVDLLPLEPVAPLFRRPRTPDPPGYIPTIRVVPAT